MANNRFTEFLTTLVAALLMGAAVFLILTYLNGAAQMIAFVVLIFATVGALRILRKRFGRGS